MKIDRPVNTNYTDLNDEVSLLNGNIDQKFKKKMISMTENQRWSE